MKRTAHRFGPTLLPRLFVIISLTCLLTGLQARAAAPGEVAGLTWCPATKNCLNWSSTPDAIGYELFRGERSGLAGLLDGTLDSCAVGEYAQPTTGPALDGEPLAGTMNWYLVTARNAEGQGSAGQTSLGPRFLDSFGACIAGSDLVLNEVDYDQPGTDYGEFVEIYNGRPTARDLTGLVLILVNGGTGEEYRRYDLADAGASLPAGAYLVVGSPNVLSALPPGTLSIPFGSNSNTVQNGAPDGVALFDTSGSGLVDALSYEGSISAAQFDGQPGSYNLVEGTPTTARDSNADDGSLSRSPNGNDTDNAESDWSFVALPTPGAANSAP